VSVAISRWNVVLSAGPGIPSGRDLHAGMAWWFYPKQGDRRHKQNIHRYTVGPPVQRDGQVVFEVRTLSSGAERALLEGFPRERRRRFPVCGGRAELLGLVHVETVTWEALASRATAVDALQLDLLSPTVWHHDARDVVVPDPALVVGSLRRRWENLAPPECRPPRLSRPPDIDVAIEGLRLEPRSTKGRGAGVTGTLILDLRRHETADRRTLDHLFQLVPFCGLGREVGHGCGTARVTRLRVEA
jgi:hypothetical protein